MIPTHSFTCSLNFPRIDVCLSSTFTWTKRRKFTCKLETIVLSSRNLFTSFLENGRSIGYQSPSSQRAAESLFDMYIEMACKLTSTV